jgi:hypothetical protein
MKIHIIEPVNKFIKLHDNVWESGYWKLDEDRANKLVGGAIYFHRKRMEPSFYGGTVLGYRVEQEGQDSGKIVFKLQYKKECRDVRTDQSGWSNKMKIVDSEP